MQYKVVGEPLPAVICDLRNGESIRAESGAMSWMSPNMQMDTNAGGGLGKAFGRMLTGESMFQNVYTARGGDGMIAFASKFPGSIRAVELRGNSIVCQKSAFLACESGVDISIFFQKKLGAGFFGGEGFIMQRVSGNGVVFLEIDGSAIEYELEAGQKMVLDTGYLAMMDDTCSVDIERVKGVKNVLFGGEGLFNTVVTGPGKIVVQTMPISNFAGMIASVIPKGN